eukprot:TRINITY_DN13592_c0_g1_i1.p1 TRINITY_DN13592_c0_g1~~TRINITY_DN13592_c0_g1_i1.p1  ORF type:complete len:142 (+),score=34.02 TRINITY_DN13592_c0_g1_i1:45-428(+)
MKLLISKAMQRCCALRHQHRFGSLRDRMNSKKTVDSFEAEVQQLNQDIENLDRRETGFAEIDRQARQAEEVVGAMTEEEIKENQEIIKRMLVRGLRAAVVVILGFWMVMVAYRRKRQEIEERRGLQR